MDASICITEPVTVWAFIGVTTDTSTISKFNKLVVACFILQFSFLGGERLVNVPGTLASASNCIELSAVVVETQAGCGQVITGPAGVIVVEVDAVDASFAAGEEVKSSTHSDMCRPPCFGESCSEQWQQKDWKLSRLLGLKRSAWFPLVIIAACSVTVRPTATLDAAGRLENA
jgi:hypothetical protein